MFQIFLFLGAFLIRLEPRAHWRRGNRQTLQALQAVTDAVLLQGSSNQQSHGIPLLSCGVSNVGV